MKVAYGIARPAVQAGVDHLVCGTVTMGAQGVSKRRMRRKPVTIGGNTALPSAADPQAGLLTCRYR